MGRRSHGEGSIYKRKKDGLWAAQYVVDTPDGKTKRKYVYGKKRKDVAEKLAEALKESGEGLLLDAGSLTVTEFLADWMDSEKESVRESTQTRREQILRLHVYPNIGQLRLGKLNALHVQRLYARKLDEGLSPGTVRLIHANLSKALQKAVRWRLVSVNVARSATAPKNKAEEVKPLTREEVKRLLDAASGDRFECLYTLAVTCGLRRGELLGLRYEDIDLKRGALQVRRSLSKGKVNLPKTSKSRRGIKLGRIALEALKRHKKRQAVLSEWVFCTNKGTPIAPRTCSGRLGGICVRGRDSRQGPTCISYATPAPLCSCRRTSIPSWSLRCSDTARSNRPSTPTPTSLTTCWVVWLTG